MDHVLGPLRLRFSSNPADEAQTRNAYIAHSFVTDLKACELLVDYFGKGAVAEELVHRNGETALELELARGLEVVLRHNLSPTVKQLDFAGVRSNRN